jgi:hypothetical protein
VASGVRPTAVNPLQDVENINLNDGFQFNQLPWAVN